MNSENTSVGTPCSQISSCASMNEFSTMSRRCVKVRESEDKVISEAHLLNQVQRLCRALDLELSHEKYERHITSAVFDGVRKRVERVFGFALQKRPSGVRGAGTGVFVSSGVVPKNHLVAIYPGMVYRPGDQVFLQSLSNAFVFRCADGVIIDGNDRSVSKLLYRSCSFRDRLGAQLTSDQTWMTEQPANPLAIGQYVNNHDSGHQANVCYQEADLPLKSFCSQLRRYIPNNAYNSAVLASVEDPALRLVLLVSLREIAAGEELFSSYFTMIT